jgi:hypothetical protein
MARREGAQRAWRLAKGSQPSGTPPGTISMAGRKGLTSLKAGEGYPALRYPSRDRQHGREGMGTHLVTGEGYPALRYPSRVRQHG